MTAGLPLTLIILIILFFFVCSAARTGLLESTPQIWHLVGFVLLVCCCWLVCCCCCFGGLGEKRKGGGSFSFYFHKNVFFFCGRGDGGERRFHCSGLGAGIVLSLILCLPRRCQRVQCLRSLSCRTRWPLSRAVGVVTSSGHCPPPTQLGWKCKETTAFLNGTISNITYVIRLQIIQPYR